MKCPQSWGKKILKITTVSCFLKYTLEQDTSAPTSAAKANKYVEVKILITSGHTHISSFTLQREMAELCDFPHSLTIL